MENPKNTRQNNKRKKIQQIIWPLLPVIIFGGLLWPKMGYLVLAMMLFFITLSLFKGRYWCGWLCTRGAFLERVVTHASRDGKIPPLLRNTRVRWVIFFTLISFMMLRMINTGGDIDKIGFVFVTMCTITTAVAIPLGIVFKPRTWCVICPMGLLQGMLGRKRYLVHVSGDCTECGLCERVCPIGTNPSSFKDKDGGKVKSIDCLRCSECIEKCPRGALEIR